MKILDFSLLMLSSTERKFNHFIPKLRDEICQSFLWLLSFSKESNIYFRTKMFKNFIKCKKYNIYTGIFLLSISTLAYEICLMRIFSITLWHHFSFMVISIALLGFGAAGTHLFFNNKLLKKKPDILLSELALIFSIFCFISYLISNYIPFDPFRIAWDIKQLLYIIIYFVLFAIPFFFSGLAISASFTFFPSNINSIYYFIFF